MAKKIKGFDHNKILRTKEGYDTFEKKEITITDEYTKKPKPLDKNEKRDEQLLEEWKECRRSITHFDSLLVDIRKYGFTIITGLLSANAFLFVRISELTLSEKFAMTFAMFVLIYALFKLDKYFEILLRSAVRRAVKIEKSLPLHLSFQISTYVERAGVNTWRWNLYYWFVLATFIAPFTTTILDEQIENIYKLGFALALICTLFFFRFLISDYESKTQIGIDVEVQCNRNRRAINLELKSKRKKAIKLYEKNVREKYEGDFSYIRLARIYREDGNKKDELRVLKSAIKVFRDKVNKQRPDRDDKLKKFSQRYIETFELP
jgi:hypothetical protein